MSSAVKNIHNPYNLLTENLIRDALQNDLKKEVTLVSYVVQDFTKKEDNHNGIVTSVKVIDNEGLK